MSLSKFVVRRKRKQPEGNPVADDKHDIAQKIFKRESESSSSLDHGAKESENIIEHEAQNGDITSPQSKTALSAESLKDSERSEIGEAEKKPVKWRKIRAENLDLDYVRLYTKGEADDILRQLEETITYNSGKLAQVMMFGKWVDIPRKQSAYGEEGLSYTFSGNTVPARPWIPSLTKIRDRISALTGFDFNFALVNRYKDGSDHMGEHKDDEKDLTEGYPIASLSLGQPRDFYFKHQDSRGKKATRKIEPVKLELEHGGLLLMNPPTNRYWYHALPKRKKLGDVRINLTFRKMNRAMCKPVK